MDILQKNQVLYCQNGDAVSVINCSDNELTLFYKGKVVKRPRDVIGSKLFLSCPPGVKPNRSTIENKPLNYSTVQKVIKVKIGSEILLQNLDTNDQCRYKIVSSYIARTAKGMSGAYYGLSYEEKKVSDAKPQEGTISDQSPIGKAVIGHIKGDEFSVFLPEGVVVKYRLIDVN